MTYRLLGNNTILISQVASANQVSVATGSSTSVWSQIYDGYIASAAAIAGTKISPNFGNQDIRTDGYVSLNSTTSAGKLRLGNGSTHSIVARNQADSNNITLLGTNSSNEIVIGDVINANVTYNTIGSHRFYKNSALKLDIVSEGLLFPIDLNNPLITQTNQTAIATDGYALTIQAQNSTNTSTNGGVLALTSGTGTLAAGKLKLQAGGVDLLTLIGSNISLFNVTGSFGSGSGVVFLANATSVPSTNPSSGGILYCEGGSLKFRGSSGSITTLGPA